MCIKCSYDLIYINDIYKYISRSVAKIFTTLEIWLNKTLFKQVYHLPLHIHQLNC